ncbi:integrase [Pandoraea sputorum]|uniref:Site-specific tyrosine recombinase XerC n=1 Tax=Pandoraea sputorum TaxID=93222 RepID=A0A239SXL6_9BURK|nr:site-specific integrase [Pandoraea sputorum]AJC15148.1 integrase [Pandoraea sputorum]SNU89568.1 site-specific tyrosine recombinase XerC [Pandoraea sputorum]
MKPGRLRRTTPPTLAAAIGRYLIEVSPLKKSQTAEQSIAKTWLSTRIAGRPIDRIRNTDVIALRDEWATEKAAATVVRRLAFLSHVFTVARKDWGWTELANPVQLVRRPMVDDARDRRVMGQIRMRGVSAEDCPRSELEWIIRATSSRELPVIVTLAAETAMRRAEICHMRREHVDLLHGVVHLPDTKNGTSRDVPLTPWARETLRQYLAGKPQRGPIFSVTPGAATRAFIRARMRARTNYEALCRSLGRRPNPLFFTDLRLHDLRHEATSVLAPIFQLHELAKISGHKSTRMLLRYYHPDGRELARKIARSPLGRKQAARIRSERDSTDV